MFIVFCAASLKIGFICRYCDSFRNTANNPLVPSASSTGERLETRNAEIIVLALMELVHLHIKQIARGKTAGNVELIMYGGDTMENGFIAKPCNFQGENGYMLDQYHNGHVVCSQFVPESSFDYFCKVAGINPKIEKLAE